MSDWPRIAGFRVVMSWPQDSQFAPAPPPRGRGRMKLAGFAGACLTVGGAAAIGVAVLAQQHAPAPAASAAGDMGSAGAKGPSLRQSPPVSITIPEIGVRSRLLHLGRNKDGSMQVPNLGTSASEAAWYKYSVTPGQIGTSIIEGHVDSDQGPAVFFRLGALKPGNHIDVTLADGITAVFRITGVREYAKDQFPAHAIYASSDHAALRVITCGGDFDPVTGRYLSSVVVFASLVSSTRALWTTLVFWPLPQGFTETLHRDAAASRRRDAWYPSRAGRGQATTARASPGCADPRWSTALPASSRAAPALSLSSG